MRLFHGPRASSCVKLCQAVLEGWLRIISEDGSQRISKGFGRSKQPERREMCQ